jgi:hypothetical protein
VQNVALVLDVLHDCDQDARVALPQEDPLNISNRTARDEILDLPIVIGQNDDWDIQPGAADFTRQLRGIHVSYGEVCDDQIELRMRTGKLQRLGATGNVGDAGNLLGVQFERLCDQEFIEAAVFAEDKRVIEAGDQKDVLDLERHQVFEAFKALFGVEDRFGCAGDGHGLSVCQLIIAWVPQDLACRAWHSASLCAGQCACKHGRKSKRDLAGHTGFPDESSFSQKPAGWTLDLFHPAS